MCVCACVHVLVCAFMHVYASICESECVCVRGCVNKRERERQEARGGKGERRATNTAQASI